MFLRRAGVSLEKGSAAAARMPARSPYSRMSWAAVFSPMPLTPGYEADERDRGAPLATPRGSAPVSDRPTGDRDPFQALRVDDARSVQVDLPDPKGRRQRPGHPTRPPPAREDGVHRYRVRSTWRALRGDLERRPARASRASARRPPPNSPRIRRPRRHPRRRRRPLLQTHPGPPQEHPRRLPLPRRRPHRRPRRHLDGPPPRLRPRPPPRTPRPHDPRSPQAPAGASAPPSPASSTTLAQVGEQD